MNDDEMFELWWNNMDGEVVGNPERLGLYKELAKMAFLAGMDTANDLWKNHP